MIKKKAAVGEVNAYPAAVLPLILQTLHVRVVLCCFAYKNVDIATAVISHTGGTTGEPKGCMLSDCNVNVEIWQVIKTMENKRQQVMLVVLAPFVNYSLVNAMMEPLCAGFTTVMLG